MDSRISKFLSEYGMKLFITGIILGAYVAHGQLHP